MHARRLPLSPLASTRRFARRAGRRALSAGVAQLAEHLFCKQVVGGSSPPASSTFSVTPGGLPERPKGAGCKPAGIAYVGSNPTPSTHFVSFSAGLGPRDEGVRSRQAAGPAGLSYASSRQWLTSIWSSTTPRSIAARLAPRYRRSGAWRLRRSLAGRLLRLRSGA
jgi:hypothetical protein